MHKVIIKIKYSANDMDFKVFKEYCILENYTYPEDNIKPSLTTEGAMTSAPKWYKI